ncbi:MAG: chloride channel protein [Myxococcales bacterium]|nr:chloride channel protein [Myxococcales bacterium]
MTGPRQGARALAEWLVLGALVGGLCGAASALFLFLLDEATALREAHPAIVYTLPVAGLAIGWLYARYGKSIRAGNNLVIDTIHDEGPRLPVRMAPMVLVGTVLTHLFGGSAGREGTAVQMGASLADTLAHKLSLRPNLRRHVLAAGVAGGFGSVFGTPIAGVVFGLEVVVLGQLAYGALLPALVASVVGDMTTRALGIVHTPYPLLSYVPLSPLLLAKWAVFAAAVALTTLTFIELTQALKRWTERQCPSLPVRMALGGLALVLLWQLVGTNDYLGLGIPMIVKAFSETGVPDMAFFLKLIFTALTLSVGFLGGEVTPLFFVGACLGSTLAEPLGLPRPLAAGVGLAAVFAAASNTPLALAVMAVELMGGAAFPHVAIVCVMAYLLTGHRSIYPSQRLVHAKWGARLPTVRRLRDVAAETNPTKSAHEDVEPS